MDKLLFSRYVIDMDKQKTIVALLGIITLVVLVAVLKMLASFLLPLVIAMLFAFALMPVSSFMSHRKVPYWLTIIFMMFIFFISILTIGYFLFSSGNTIVREFPKYFNRFESLTNQMIGAIQARFDVDVSSYLSELDWFSPLRSLIVSFFRKFIRFHEIPRRRYYFSSLFSYRKPSFSENYPEGFSQGDKLSYYAGLSPYSQRHRPLSGLEAPDQSGNGSTRFHFIKTDRDGFCLHLGNPGVHFEFCSQHRFDNFHVSDDTNEFYSVLSFTRQDISCGVFHD